MTIDCDGFDPALMPGNGSPSPGGLTYHEGVDLLRGIAELGDVVGFDFVEVAPMYDPTEITQQTAARIVLDFLGAIFKARERRRARLGEAPLEPLPHRRPLVLEDREDGRVAQQLGLLHAPAPGAEDALELGADADDRAPRALVAGVALQRHPLAAQLVEGVVSRSSFAAGLTRVPCHGPPYHVWPISIRSSPHLMSR